MPIEELEGGIKAAFVNLPHFRTTSARLTINSGSMHELPETAGSAHFLEHITFQGTEDLPSDVEIHQYSDEHSISHNAHTGFLGTTFEADGYKLETTLNLLAQIALSPLLDSGSLEKERKPITDEIRGYQSSPDYYAHQRHRHTIWGDLFAREITGTIPEVQTLTHEHLTEYYERNYALPNALIVVCSGRSIDEQREYTQKILSKQSRRTSGQTMEINLPTFNPLEATSSLAVVDLPESAQTTININFGLPNDLDEYNQYKHIRVIESLSQAVSRRLRSELAICYGAHASFYGLVNRHFDQRDNRVYAYITASLHGNDSVSALDSIVDDVVRSQSLDKFFESTIVRSRRSVDYQLQNNPQNIAPYVLGTILSCDVDAVDLERAKSFSERVTIEELKQIQQDIAESKPLVSATSPSQSVLDGIGEWATNNTS